MYLRRIGRKLRTFVVRADENASRLQSASVKFNEFWRIFRMTENLGSILIESFSELCDLEKLWPNYNHVATSKKIVNANNG